MDKFELKTKLRQTTVLDKIICLANGKIPEPVVIDFDCTTRCNLSCPFCISKNIIGNLEFSKEQLMQWADVISEMNVKALILTGGGEPLMNSNIDDFIARLKTNNAQLSIGLVTNGVLLHKHTRLECLDWVRISLDAGNRETFCKLKGKDYYKQILYNVVQYNKVKHGETGISFLVVNNKECSNIEEIYIAAKQAKEIGCDYFEVKLQFDDDHVDIPLQTEKTELIREQIMKSLKLSCDSFQIYINHNIKRLLGKKDTDFQDPIECPICFLRTVVTPRGLYVCSYYRGNSYYKYGESIPSEFKEKWFSKARSEFIRHIHPCRDCRFNCARKESNIEIQRIMKEMGENNYTLKPVKDSDLFI